MSDITVKNGWERLSNGFDVEFRHGIPVRLSDNGKTLLIPASTLIEEITALGGLDIRLGDWQPGEGDSEREAQLWVSGEQLDEVLRRLALAAAAVFVDRYGKAIDRDDIDWDTLEYVNDFRTALHYCGLDADDVDQDSHRDSYLDTMHRETRRLAASPDTPPVEPEE
jgi:hypothetical protein